MATNYTRIYRKAVGEAFDGSKTNADALVTAYPGVISVQKVESTYPLKPGANSLAAASTGVTGTFTNTAVGTSSTAAVVKLTVTHKCNASGNVTIKVRNDTGVVTALLDTDDIAGVATKIRASSYTGWTTSGTGAEVIWTLNAANQADSILNVLNEAGGILNAYKDTVIVWESNFGATTTIKVWKAADFSAWFV